MRVSIPLPLPITMAERVQQALQLMSLLLYKQIVLGQLLQLVEQLMVLHMLMPMEELHHIPIRGAMLLVICKLHQTAILLTL